MASGLELLFSIWSAATGLFLCFLAWRTFRFTRSLINLRDFPERTMFPPGRKQWPRVSMVIPACNEETTIASAAESLLALKYPNLEIILVNDRSTDRTGQIIDDLAERDVRIRALHIQTLPDGWLGKVHALEKGMALTTGEWILLTDADVHFSPGALRKAIAYCVAENLDFLTVIPDVHTRGFGLQLMMSQLFHQASIFFDPARINDPDHRACYGQGAFNLVRRATYERSEKMAWLKMEVVDDTGLAYLMRRAGAKMGAVSGLNEIKIEWYPSLRSFLRGLEKNGFAFMQYSWLVLLVFLSGMLSVFFGFSVAPVLSGSPTVMVFCLASLTLYLAVIQHQLRQIIHTHPFTVLLFPVSFLLLAAIVVRSAILASWRGGIDWRGTFYKLSDLRREQRMKLMDLVSGSGEKFVVRPFEPGQFETLHRTEDIEMIERSLSRYSAEPKP